MPKSLLAEYPQPLRPYAFHHLDFSYRAGQTETQGECPFCGSSKFYISVETGLYSCKVGGESGNAFTFIRDLHKFSVASDGDLELVADERGIPVWILRKWGLTKSLIDGEWILPAYGPKGEINNLYVWRKAGDKRRLQSTAEFTHCLFGTQFWDEHRANVIVAEGPWDAMAIEMALSEVKREGEKIVVAQSPEGSMVGNYNIVAVPGCETFRDEWQERFAGKNTYLIFDNDYPRLQKNTGKMLPPAGYRGMQRVVEKLSANPTPPFALNIVRWGADGHNSSLPDGYDLRDYFTTSHDGDTIAQVTELLSMLGPAPSEWLTGNANGTAVALPVPKLASLSCSSYEDLIVAWRKTFSWSDALDITLSVMMATAISTRGLQDQVWVRIIGNAGSGKTTLCQAMKVFDKGVFMVSQFTGLHSGYTGPGSKGDAGMIPQINGRTLIINEGDTLLKNPNRDRIMAELRDLHCGFASNFFLNGVRNTYEGIRTTVLLAGTGTIRELNKSALGDRFLDCIIYNRRSRTEERKLVRKDLLGKLQTCLQQSNCEAQTQDTPDRIRACQLTGGYLEYLSSVVGERQRELEITEEYSDSCETLGDLIAHMRTRPHDDDSPVEKEVHYRLSTQLGKLGIYLAVVMNRPIDGEILRRLAKVADDTCHGLNYDIANKLYEQPLDVSSLENRLRHSRDKINKGLATLRELECVVADATVSKSGATRRNVHIYKLTDNARLLLSKVKNLLAHSTEEFYAGTIAKKG